MNNKIVSMAKDTVGLEIVKTLLDIKHLIPSQRLYNKYWQFISDKWYITQNVIEKFLNEPWSWNVMSNNPNITLDFVIKHKKCHKWNWAKLSRHPNITMNDIKNNLKFKWKPHKVSQNPNVDINFILECENIYGFRLPDLDWYTLSRCNNITCEDIIKYPNYPWRFHAVGKRQNITAELINTYSRQIFNKPYAYTHINVLSKYLNIDDIVNVNIKNKLLNIKNAEIKRRAEQYAEQFKKNKYNLIKINEPDTIEIIQEKLKQKNWRWPKMQQSEYIEIHHIKNNPKLKWSWYNLSHNPNITIDLVIEKQNENWNWKALSQNPGIKMSDIEKNIELPWKWGVYGISSNPNITPQFIRKYKNYPIILDNVFKLNYENYFNTIYRKLLARYMIIEKRIAIRKKIGKKDVQKYFK